MIFLSSFFLFCGKTDCCSLLPAKQKLDLTRIESRETGQRGYERNPGTCNLSVGGVFFLFEKKDLDYVMFVMSIFSDSSGSLLII